MWKEHVLNPRLIPSIFKNKEPSLKQIQMQEIAITFGGDLQCRIHFDLKDFPSEAPEKWVQSKYNTVRMSLALIDADVKHFSVCGGVIIGDLSVVFENSSFEVEFKTDGAGLVFRATARWINVDKVSGYVNS